MRVCRDCGVPHDSDLVSCPACGWAPGLRNGFVAYAPELDAAGTAGFKPEAFDELARLEEGHFWFQARNRIILWAVGRHAPDPRRIMEIGCGTGSSALRLAPGTPDVVDFANALEQVCIAALAESLRIQAATDEAPRRARLLVEHASDGGR